MTETFTHTIEGTSTAQSTAENKNSGTNTQSNESFIVESDTPPTELTEDDIKANKYASKTDHNKNTSNETLGTQTNSTGNVNSTDSKTETYTRTEKGSSKGFTFAQNVSQWRDIMINVEEEIIKELGDLFINVW
jgi:hypothetical protein